MRDDLTFVERMRQDLAAVQWAPPEELRTRARLRGRRRAAAAVAAVLVVIASVSTLAVTGRVGHGRSTPLVAAPGEPELVEIPREALLQRGDVASEVDVQLSSAGAFEFLRLDPLLQVCASTKGLRVSAEPSRYSRSQTLMSHREPGAEHLPSDVVLNQDLYRFSRNAAGQLFADVDRLVSACARWNPVGAVGRNGRTLPADGSHRWKVADRGFAGDESMLLEHTIEVREQFTRGMIKELRTTGTGPTAVVRVGDLVTVIGTEAEMSREELRRLSRVAAERMCVAANPRC